MADLYNPAEGSIDFGHFFETDDPNEFNATDISDPAALNKALERGLIQHGFVSPSGKSTYQPKSTTLLTPTVPDDDDDERPW
jgi:hypothetical protein